MEKEQWIQKILNSTQHLTVVEPDAALFSKIEAKINRERKLSPTAVWAVAASIAALLVLNVAVIQLKTKNNPENTAAYWEHTFNKSNQLY
ncbi:hypothetical protein [Flavobacterium sp.]|uniref:hypothetical protein n=1 Tax=Flavobacterium sp. TaxID=239 RepID=UPI002FDE9664